MRDFALVYYCLFAFFTVAALARAPDLLDRWLAQLARFVPWLLIWLPIAVVLPVHVRGLNVPFSGISVLTHKPGNVAIAAVVALGAIWLFPGTRSARSRAALSILALVAMALSATQNRGGLVGATAGGLVGLMFLPARDRLRLIVRAVAVATLGLSLAVQLSLKIPTGTSPGPGVLGVTAHRKRDEHRRRTVRRASLERWQVVTCYGHWSTTSRCAPASSSTGSDSV